MPRTASLRSSRACLQRCLVAALLLALALPATASAASPDVEQTDILFDPGEDGIDFWESLEGMLVQVEDARAVGPTNGFDETPVVAARPRRPPRRAAACSRVPTTPIPSGSCSTTTSSGRRA